MNYNNLKEKWKYEESYAFKGWDFSHISERWTDEVIPWNYSEILLAYLKNTDRLLDMGTGDGKYLMSLKHPNKLTEITEAYPPNLELCRKVLEPLGIAVKQVYDDDVLPFANQDFDIVINRHESFNTSEVYRILKSGGYFVTQQVGGKNDIDLSNRLIADFVPQFPDHDLKNSISLLIRTGFEIIKSEEAFTPVRFYDVGALVYFAKTIEWEFPGFSVESSFAGLCECQKDIEEKGFVEGTEHRFVIVARKL